MLETAVDNKVTKGELRQREDQLRVDLVNAQHDLKRARFSCIVLLAGDDRRGVEALTDRLNEWMDQRFIDTRFFGKPDPVERLYPRPWRYWNELPPHGRIALWIGAWPLMTIADRLSRRLDKGEFTSTIDHIRRHEEELVVDGTLLLKIWLHLPKKARKKQLARARKNGLYEPRAEDADWDIHEVDDNAIAVADEFLERTNSSTCPWTVVDSADPEHRDLTVAVSLLAALQQRLAADAAPRVELPPPPRPPVPARLAAVDLSPKLDDAEFEQRLAEQQARLGKLVRKARKAGLPSVFAIEGWDAAGKGGALRRLAAAISARDLRLWPIAAPSDDERARHWLWRFWRRLPRPGQVAVFDRSWYGRVLVERVEQLATPAAWLRAYDEIRDFEAMLTEHGMAMAKIWLHIDRDEQLRRFHDRETAPYKAWKITDDDWRNREQWNAYVAAVDEMLARTDSKHAPWHVIAANDKRSARVEVLARIGDAIARALDR